MQIYVQMQPNAEVSNLPNPQLKGLKKVTLQPGQTQEIVIHLPVKAFSLYDEAGNCIVYPGKCNIYVGAHGPDKRSCALTGTEDTCLSVSVQNKIIIA